MMSISCLNCENDISFNPDDFKNIGKPSVKCGKCGLEHPLTQEELQALDDLE